MYLLVRTRIRRKGEMSMDQSKKAGRCSIAEEAVICGDVSLGEDVSVWYHATLRADTAPLVVGNRTNIQDNVVIHAGDGCPVTLGEDVTVGHGAILHGCTIGDNTVVGMGAIVLNGAVVGRDCMIGAGALVTQGMQIPDGSLAFGNPARVKRTLTSEEIHHNHANAEHYVIAGRKQLP